MQARTISIGGCSHSIFIFDRSEVEHRVFQGTAIRILFFLILIIQFTSDNFKGNINIVELSRVGVFDCQLYVNNLPKNLISFAKIFADESIWQYRPVKYPKHNLLVHDLHTRVE